MRERKRQTDRREETNIRTNGCGERGEKGETETDRPGANRKSRAWRDRQARKGIRQTDRWRKTESGDGQTDAEEHR